MATNAWVPTGNDLSRLRGELRQAIQYLSLGSQQLRQLYQIATQMVSGSDYTGVEQYFGVPSGQGQNLVNVLGTASNDLQGSNVQGLLRRRG